MNKTINKLTLNKETLRDLTSQNTREVKGGTSGKVLTCLFTYFCTGAACPNKTFNKKCGY